MSPRGVKTSSCCSLKCSETAAGHELVSLSPSVHQLPALASRAATHHIRGPRGRPPPRQPPPALAKICERRAN